MKILYLDCAMGAAGDMLTAALLELMPDKEAAVAELNGLHIPGVTFRAEKSIKGGICGTHMRVLVGNEEEDGHCHGHSHMTDIAHILSHLSASDWVKENAKAVYEKIAQAESRVHGVPVEEVHFHEVGAMDAVADVTAVCYLLEKLKVDKICVSPIHTGTGYVNCAHGTLPVPAPATAQLLLGIPIYGGEIQGELCTPTGAALLRHFAETFGPIPPMTVTAVGYGMGKKDFSRPNCLRAMVGTSTETAERIWELSCNIDDMTGEEMGFATEQLLAQGALDVFTTPVYMKKNRPGIVLTALCREETKEEILRAIFRYTTTLGIREISCGRHTLHRQELQEETPWGIVRKKVSHGYGTHKEKYEYEDLASIAREQGFYLNFLKKP